MKSILTGSKVHGSNRHIFANAPNVIERQTIDPTCIAIAMSTGEIALVGEPKADRKTFAARFFHHLGRITFGHDDPPTGRCWHCRTRPPQGKRVDHGVIIKPITTNICGSDQHMVRGRTTAPPGLVLGHEITGEVIECGSGVEFISKGDLVSVPFNVACGRCRNCKERRTDVCLNVNPSRAGGAYGYVDLGGWVGGQAEYVMVPYADWNLLRFPDKDQALAKIRDLTCLTDILPTATTDALARA
jgi:threonine dehydrogenase-like Zn-dependent dehydrogenase